MGKTTSTTQPYLALVEFLMITKHNVIDAGLRYKLTPMQSMTLLLLEKPKPMNSFTTIFNCDASNVTGIIDGLEQKNMAERYEHPTDRRIKMVRIKPEGTKVRSILIQKLTSGKDCVLANLSKEETATFFQLIEKVIRGSKATA
jgi:DNA-binding MarR family transcriptional regulator